MTKTKLADWSRARMELKMLPTSGNLIVWTWSVESQETSEKSKHSAALFHNSNQDVEMAMHGDNFVCLLDDDRLNTSILFSNPKTQQKTWRTLGFKDSNFNNLVSLNCGFRVGVDWTRQHLYVESDVKLEPLIIKPGCNTKTETMSTPWQKLKDKPMLDGRQNLILNKIDATVCRSVCLKLSYLAQDRLDFAETVRQLAN